MYIKNNFVSFVNDQINIYIYTKPKLKNQFQVITNTIFSSVIVSLFIAILASPLQSSSLLSVLSVLPKQFLFQSTRVQVLLLWLDCAKKTIHQVTTMLATSKNILFIGHNHQYYTAHPSLVRWLSGNK